jgi:hypothetical protein
MEIISEVFPALTSKNRVNKQFEIPRPTQLEQVRVK